jgi:hypothetical protein
MAILHDYNNNLTVPHEMILHPNELIYSHMGHVYYCRIGKDL